jgi:hypothetical protein
VFTLTGIAYNAFNAGIGLIAGKKYAVLCASMDNDCSRDIAGNQQYVVWLWQKRPPVFTGKTCQTGEPGPIPQLVSELYILPGKFHGPF